jgi:hypothetical protein
MTTDTSFSPTRRKLLKGAAGIATTAAASTLGAPMIWAQNIKDVTIRQFGTGVSNLNDVAVKVKEDLGFTLQMTALDSDAVTQRAATQPNSFDIADIEYWIAKKVWPTGAHCSTLGGRVAPRIIAAQVESKSLPSGLTIPMPVITTRRLLPLPFVNMISCCASSSIHTSFRRFAQRLL